MRLFILNTIGDSILELFIKPSAYEMEGAYDTALSWVITGFVIAMLATFGMQVIKWLLKAGVVLVKRHWSRLKTITFMATGMLPVFATLLAIYYFTLDYTNVLGPFGLFNGVFFAWLVYIVLMVLSDLVFPWSRNDYKFQRRV